MHLKPKSSACALAATLACSFFAVTGCGPAAMPAEVSAGEAVVQAGLSTSHGFNVTNTNSAQQNTKNVVITLNPGDTVEVGTCGLEGASGTGDTYLRMVDAAGNQVAVNDDGCGGTLSYFKYTLDTHASTGSFTVRAGCFYDTSCSGTMVVKVTPPPPGSPGLSFNLTNTNSAQQNTANSNVTLTAGQVLKLGTCTVPGSSGTGDTLLRLFGPAGTEVAMNDDACGTLSYLAYTVPTSGTYQIRAGCYSNQSCSGTVAYTLE
jgi:hypothetical protein